MGGVDTSFPSDYVERLLGHRVPEAADPPTRRAAVAIVLRPAGPAPELLLMTRVEHEHDPWSGQVSLPGGGHAPSDPDLLATAVRETREEVGLDLGCVGKPLGRLATIGAIARGGPLPMDITPFVFLLEGRHELRIGVEARDAFWLPLERTLRGELDGRYPYRHGDVERQLPCWQYEGRVIWGLTYRMIADLLGVVTGAASPRT
ncbi:MAG: NUDIX hydrolase [Planctomycetota bacterium]|jgi:8-oxo-dGTP pyrophosphatase MutT (NUDIX family)